MDFRIGFGFLTARLFQHSPYLFKAFLTEDIVRIQCVQPPDLTFVNDNETLDGI